MDNRADGEMRIGDHVVFGKKQGVLDRCNKCRSFYVRENILEALGISSKCDCEDEDL